MRASSRYKRSCVYFVVQDETGHVKIGVTSSDPKGRSAAIQTCSPLRVTLMATMPGDEEEEIALHIKFWHLHVRGEWFVLSPELRAYIAANATAHPPSDDQDPHVAYIAQRWNKLPHHIRDYAIQRVQGVDKFTSIRSMQWQQKNKATKA